MSNFWSDYVQGTMALDYDRRRRIRDEQKELYLLYLGLNKDSTIVDIGCGPGNFSRQISKWLEGRATIIGIERDHKFLEYAKAMAHEENLANIEYIEADAMSLPLGDESVDACYSTAVIQYVNPENFLLEQKRVCKPGGSVSVMNMIPGAKYYSHDCLPEKSKREQELWDCILQEGDETLKKWDLLKHEMKPFEYPGIFEKAGFRDIEVNAISLFYAADDARNSLTKKIEIVDADRHNDLEVIEIAFNHLNKTAVSSQVKDELIGLVNRRYDQRIELIKSGKKVWDFRISTLLIVKGTK